jgi:phosphoribosylamine--glycine ligase
VVVGAGGREHALARGLAVGGVDVVVTPGNPGMPARLAAGSIRIDPGGASQLEADLYVIGPEVPLVEGLADRLRAQGRLVLGPGADGAKLEGSKSFMKELLADAGVPTAEFWSVDDLDEARSRLEHCSPPFVIKTDGLAAGKGVLVTQELDEALADVAEKLSGRSFGPAGTRVVIEEGLEGPECSLMALCDGTRAVALAPAQDFKRLRSGDAGPNTGGMGAYSPMPGIDAERSDELLALTVEPTLAALRARGIDYRGVLYAGLMLTSSGPKVIEFNVRFGDPETQVVIPRVESDLFELLASAAAGALSGAPAFSGDAAVTVVLAAPGYPASPQVGGVIRGLGPDGQLAEPLEGVTVFHAGTSRQSAEGPFVVSGGRVLSVTGLGATLAQARERAYRAVARIEFDGMQRREDIAAAAAKEEEQ